MFFYLAKILWFFVQPLNLAIFLLLAGLLAGLFGWRRLMATSAAPVLPHPCDLRLDFGSAH